jgi:6-methylsalicylic acid synthase
MNPPEPIAVVGMACRFAGGIDTVEDFWTLLREGRDAIGEILWDRWDWYASQSREHAAVLRDVTKRGAFLDDVKGFDADFFDITPREAELMDPQQRIMLELAWEALEHAGIPARDLRGTDAGVFVGVGADDYGRRLLEDLPRIEAWTGICGAYCAVANRVSYTLDLRGPSVAVDTACSSSLAAIHLAVQALRSGECPVALAGGGLIMAAPGLSVVLDAAGATARDGRSKPFDANADGYGRGEGGGLVVLKRASDASRDGDRVLGLILGSAVRQDGKTNGIMAPSAPAQAHLMRQAYLASGVEPATVSYVEAHGTGTRVGDPIEAEAMASVFGADRPAERPLLIGSVKANIGHLEAGAGVASVIKTLLALRNAEIPPSLNFTTPNPDIPWDTAGLKVVTEPTRWPDTDGPVRAGVSGYGYGGTIAHVILERADEPGEPRSADAEAALYPLSGASEAAVRQYAGRLADRLWWDTGTGTADVGYTLARRRTPLPYRAAVFAADREQLMAQLRDFAESGTATATGKTVPAAGNGLVWMFSGHGSQWTGMARELLATDRAFAEVIDAIEPVFAEEMEVALRATLLSDAQQPVDVIQPLIFAVQVALAASWRALGVHPDAVIGHSVGEIAAAVTAGVFTLEQGARLVCRRSMLLRRVAGHGAMAMVNLSAEQASQRIGDRSDLAVAVAASTGSSVISGDIAAIETLCEQWRSEGLHIRPVDSNVAFHSQHMDPLLDDLARAAADLVPAEPTIRLYATALDNPRADTARDGAYWAANLRGQVRFAQAVTAAAEDGYRLFLEVSPHPVVEHSTGETLDELGVRDAYTTHSLRRKLPERETMLTSLGQLYCHGADVDWSGMWADGHLAELPTTVWQRKPYWADYPSAGHSPQGSQHDPASHTLLGGQTTINGTSQAQVWLTSLDHASRPYPGDHPVRGVEIVPAAVLLNTFLTAAASIDQWPDLADVTLRVPVTLTSTRDIQVVLQDGTIRLSSRRSDDVADEMGWLTHTIAAVEPHTSPTATADLIADLTADMIANMVDMTADQELPDDSVVTRLASAGVAAMGFPWAIDRIRRREGTVVAEIRPDAGSGNGTGTGSDDALRTWASVLDAATSIASAAFDGPPMLRMPSHIDRVSLSPQPPDDARIHVHQISDDTVDVKITDAGGTVVGRLTGLRFGMLDGDVDTVASPRRLIYEIAWRPTELREAGGQFNVVLVGPDTALLGRLTERFGDTGIPHRVVSTPEALLDSDLTSDHTILVVPAMAMDDDVSEAAARSAWLLSRTAQRLAGAKLAVPARLWCVTHGVQESAEERSLSHGSLWGLGRIIGGEHPELWGGVIDIGRSSADIPGLIEVLRSMRGEDVVVVRDGKASVPRLRQLVGEPVRPPITCRADGTYLITGGLGALGLEIAQWLANHGMRRVVLAGRRSLPTRDAWDELTDPGDLRRVATIRSLERLGVTVATVAVDIADPEATEKLLSPAALGLPPIRGVVHAAGVLDSRTLRTLDEESLRTVLRPKVNGAMVLHSMFPPGSVDFFVLFSSVGQLLGLAGQASYAAGNAFLDSLAVHRAIAGDAATTSFGWTSWRGLGMSTSSEVINAELGARGVADVTLDEAFKAWELASRYDLSYAAVLRTDPTEGGERRLPLLSELPQATGQTSSAEPEGCDWPDLEGEELVAYLTEEITRQVATETRLATDEIDPRRPLLEMGIDSVMTVRIRRALEGRFRLPLPATLFWDRPTVEAVAELLAELFTAATLPC